MASVDCNDFQTVKSKKKAGKRQKSCSPTKTVKSGRFEVLNDLDEDISDIESLPDDASTKQQFSIIIKSLQSLKVRFDKFNSRVIQLEQKVSTLQEENTHIKHELETVKKGHNYQDRKLLDMREIQAQEEYANIQADQQARRNNIRIYNIPYKHEEKPVVVADAFLKETLPNVKFEIKHAYRTYKKTEKPIVVEFQSAEDASKVLYAARNHSNPEKGKRIRRDMSYRHLAMRQRNRIHAEDMEKRGIKCELKADCVNYNNEDYFISSSGLIAKRPGSIKQRYQEMRGSQRVQHLSLSHPDGSSRRDVVVGSTAFHDGMHNSFVGDFSHEETEVATSMVTMAGPHVESQP